MLEAAGGNPIPISKMLFQADPFEFAKPDAYHHILCDPPQGTPEDVRRIYDFLPVAHRSLKAQGWFLFFFPIFHFERLAKAAEAAGFLVQPWPIVWNKTDYNRHEAILPTTMFPPSYETMMVCRKPSTILYRAQHQACFSASGRMARKDYLSKSAKPYSFWLWIISAIGKNGQTVFIPWANEGAAVVATLGMYLRPIACEPTNFPLLLSNVQAQLLKKLGSEISFT